MDPVAVDAIIRRGAVRLDIAPRPRLQVTPQVVGDRSVEPHQISIERPAVVADPRRWHLNPDHLIAQRAVPVRGLAITGQIGGMDVPDRDPEHDQTLIPNSRSQQRVPDTHRRLSGEPMTAERRTDTRHPDRLNHRRVPNQKRVQAHRRPPSRATGRDDRRRRHHRRCRRNRRCWRRRRPRPSGVEDLRDGITAGSSRAPAPDPIVVGLADHCDRRSQRPVRGRGQHHHRDHHHDGTRSNAPPNDSHHSTSPAGIGPARRDHRATRRCQDGHGPASRAETWLKSP